MDAGSKVWSIAVSQDRKWIMSGGEDSHVTVWDAESHAKVVKFRGHNWAVLAVDISPDRTRFTTRSDDGIICVWSLSMSECYSSFSSSFRPTFLPYSLSTYLER